MKTYVLTGPPGSGKSAILLSLEYDHRERVERESAEDYIRLCQARGDRTPWLDPDFQDHILRLSMLREGRAQESGADRVFFDRGLIDGLAYYQRQGRNPSPLMREAMQKARLQPYTKIFLVENLGNCETNQVRRENMEEALDLERKQHQNYTDLGYQVVRVPPGPLEERVAFVLKECER